jgi:hypothetical protein
MDAALKRWPGDHTLQFYQAEYWRYVWHHDKAIDGFRAVATSAPSGELRREASISLARTLHAAATHGDAVRDDNAVRQLRESLKVINAVLPEVEEASEVVILRDHLAFELGETVDWSSLQASYDHIVGKIDGFPTTLIEQFDSVSPGSDGTPSSIAGVLEANFTDSLVFGAAGLLYLRRAETGKGNDREDDFRRAVALFRAQSLLERSWDGSEHAATAFRLGRSILSAAEIFGTPNPIRDLPTDGKRDQLRYAEAKFSSAVSRSTGEFREMARRYQGRAARLSEMLQASPRSQ